MSRAKPIESSSKQLGPYLAGLIEGDGSLITPSSLRTPSGKIKVCYIQIVFALHELP